jgi:hypothetical protein
LALDGLLTSSQRYTGRHFGLDNLVSCSLLELALERGTACSAN